MLWQPCPRRLPSATPRRCFSSPPPSTPSRHPPARSEANACRLLIDTSDSSIAQSATVTENVLGALKDCPTQSYVIVEQDGVSSADYTDGRSTPALTQYMGGRNGDIKTTFSIPEVVGEIDSAFVLSYLKNKCGSDLLDNRASAVYTLKAPSASKSSRARELQSNGKTKPRRLQRIKY